MLDDLVKFLTHGTASWSGAAKNAFVPLVAVLKVPVRLSFLLCPQAEPMLAAAQDSSNKSLAHHEFLVQVLVPCLDFSPSYSTR